MLDDAFFNVEAWINSELATEFAEQEEIAFTTGDGTKKPKGFLAYESTDETDKVRAFGKLQHIVSGEATAVTADAIIKLIYTLRKAHRTGAKFMMNNNSLFAIRLLKDSEGNYLWRPGLELGQPSSLAGYGIAENEQMPDIAADAKAIAFGNFKRGYTIVDRIGTRILRDPYTNKPFVGFYTTKRTGGMLVDSQAIKLLKIAAAYHSGAQKCAPVLTGERIMILKQDLKWSPDGMRVEIIRAGEYEDKELPERVREIATAAGIVSDKRTPVARGLISLKNSIHRGCPNDAHSGRASCSVPD